MSDPSDTPSRRRKRRRKATAATPAAEPAVQVILEQALHPDPAALDAEAAEAGPSEAEVRGAATPAADTEAAPAAESVPDAEPPPSISDWHDVTATWKVSGDAPETPPSAYRDDDGEVHPHPDHETAPHDDAFAAGQAPPPPPPPAPATPHDPVPHHWVYLAVGLFVAALGFGVWGVWTVFFAGGDGSGTSVTALRTRTDRLSQEVSTLRRSDQISRDANRDLERTLAERDEEIASLRADIAFYERFVGATGQRRGLSVHDLEMRRQDGDAWHFVATLTQNVNRGAVNSGRLTLSIEGTRRDRMERLAWTTLRKQPNAPGAEYSFKYFQQLEGEILLPADFKPLRVTVRLVPQGGAAVEQSFPWPETLHSVAGG